MRKILLISLKYQLIFRSMLKRYYINFITSADIDKSVFLHPRSLVEITEFSTKRLQIKIGENTKIKRNALIAPRSGTIIIGSNVSINPNSIILGYGGIHIGNNVRIAANTSIIAFNHNFDDLNTPIALQGNNCKGISIHDDVWIGSGVRILDGVSIGKGSVIGAGSVVTKNVPEFSVAVGIPCKVIKQRA